MNFIFNMIFLITVLFNFFAILAIALDAEDIIDMEDIIMRIKMIFPKYKAQAKLEEAYTKLLHASYTIKSNKAITAKDKENLAEIEESLAIIYKLLSCKGNIRKYKAVTKLPDIAPSLEAQEI